MKIIHRNLKPENILISKREKDDLLYVKIGGFATAKMNEEGIIEEKNKKRNKNSF